MFKVGEEIEVLVTKYDKETKRISLGLKQLTEDPWKKVEELYEVGKKLNQKSQVLQTMERLLS